MIGYRRLCFAACTAAGLSVATAAAQDAIVTFKSLSPDVAVEAAQAALESCRAEGYQVAVSVVDRGGNLLGGLGIQRRTEHGDQAGGGGAKGDAAGGQRQEPLHVGKGGGVFRQPVGRIFARQIDQDGIGIGDHGGAVLDHRHLAERVERQERLLLVLAG